MNTRLREIYVVAVAIVATGSATPQYVAGQSTGFQESHGRRSKAVISLKVASMASLNDDKKLNSGCEELSFGSRIAGTMPNRIQLVMSCKTTLIVCGTTKEPLDKAEDGAELTCGNNGFYVGQILRFENNGSGEYLLLDFTGFDGTYEPSNRRHLKPWQIESESEVSTQGE